MISVLSRDFNFYNRVNPVTNFPLPNDPKYHLTKYLSSVGYESFQATENPQFTALVDHEKCTVSFEGPTGTGLFNAVKMA
jgi:hypothetical protein